MDNQLSERIIKCAIEVHRSLGPGLLESLYEKALCYEFEIDQIRYQKQVQIPIIYKEKNIGEHRIDLIVEDSIILELKATNKMDPVFKAQLLSYLKLANKRLGLLINFNSVLLKDGINRIAL